MVVYGCAPGWALAKEICPAGCQSCVRMTCANFAASALTTGTISSPPATASAPPGQKSFCISITSRASVLGLRVVVIFLPNESGVYPYYADCEKYPGNLIPLKENLDGVRAARVLLWVLRVVGDGKGVTSV